MLGRCNVKAIDREYFPFGLLIVEHPSGSTVECTNIIGTAETIDSTHKLFYVKEAGTCSVTIKKTGASKTRTIEFSASDKGKQKDIAVAYDVTLYNGGSDVGVFTKKGSGGAMAYNADTDIGGALRFYNCLAVIGLSGDYPNGVSLTGHEKLRVVCGTHQNVAGTAVLGVSLSAPTTANPTWEASKTIQDTTADTPVTVDIPLIVDGTESQWIPGMGYLCFKDTHTAVGNALYIKKVQLL